MSKPHYCMELADSEERLKRCFAACKELEEANGDLRKRIMATGDVLKIARKATTARWDLIGGMPSQVEDLRDALDRLDAVDKPKEEEALK